MADTSDPIPYRAAAERQIVVLDDGRVAQLVFLPGGREARATGSKARVLLPSGAYVSWPPERLRLADEVEQLRHHREVASTGGVR